MGIKSKLTRNQRQLKKLLIQNKKSLYKSLFRYHGQEGYYTEKLNGRYDNNPTFGVKLIRLFSISQCLKLQDIGHNDIKPLVNWFYAKYFKYYFQPKIGYGKLPTPHMDKTEALKEFLARGFVYQSDFSYDIYTDYVIKCNLAPLIYPKTFTQHQDSIKFAGKIGISGYTECPILKEK